MESNQCLPGANNWGMDVQESFMDDENVHYFFCSCGYMNYMC
jgi:hypothetical protein